MQTETRETQLNPASRPQFAVQETQPEEQRKPASAPVQQAEAFHQPTFGLSYACVLIPRFSDHYLSGDITLNLPVWLREICVSYGWRLENVVIRPGYMQWIVTVPHQANPAQILRLTRQHTSQKILAEFPRFKQQNLAGDFWAPGYSVISGNQLQAPEMISSFIQLTRKQQGIY